MEILRQAVSFGASLEEKSEIFILYVHFISFISQNIHVMNFKLRKTNKQKKSNIAI